MKLSVIMPVYNEKATIEETLRRIMAVSSKVPSPNPGISLATTTCTNGRRASKQPRIAPVASHISQRCSRCPQARPCGLRAFGCGAWHANGGNVTRQLKVRVASSATEQPDSAPPSPIKDICLTRGPRGILDVMQTSKYSDSYLKEAGKDAPQLTDQVLRAIASPLDLGA